MPWIAAFASSVSLGFLYFVSAVPAGMAGGLTAPVAALGAWLGYGAGGALVAFAGAPLRDWLLRRLPPRRDAAKPTLVQRVWTRFGLWGLGLIAPVTVGPQLGAALALTLGAPRGRAALALWLGALPWAALFASLAALGVKIVR